MSKKRIRKALRKKLCKKIKEAIEICGCLLYDLEQASVDEHTTQYAQDAINALLYCKDELGGNV